MSRIDTDDLVSRIRLLRDEVVLAVSTAIGGKHLVRPTGRRGWVPDATNHPSLPRDRDGGSTLPRDWRKLEERWHNVLGWRVPPDGTAEYKELQSVLALIEGCVSLSRQLPSPQGRAAAFLVDVYVEPFTRLEQITLHLAEKTDPIGAFLNAHRKASLEIERKLAGRQGVFVSINHGSTPSDDNGDISGIRYMLDHVAEMKFSNRVVFCWARDPEFQSTLVPVATNAWLLMHACQTVACFFTTSNVQEKKIPHNPNVCLELGAAIALQKRPGIFFAKGSSDALREQLKEFAMIKGEIITRYDAPDDLEGKIVSFIESRLGVSLPEKAIHIRSK